MADLPYKPEVLKEDVKDFINSADPEDRTSVLQFLQKTNDLRNQYSTIPEENVEERQEILGNIILNETALNKYLIKNESFGKKTSKWIEATGQGINKGFTEMVGLPVDIVNMAFYLGENKVREALTDMGIDLPDTPLFDPKNAVGGSESLKTFYDKLGLETEYDKTRADTAIIGRSMEEIGASAPMLPFFLKGLKSPIKTATGEIALAGTVGGAAGAVGNLTDSSLAELWTQTLGYLTPMGVKSIYNNTQAGEFVSNNFNKVFKPEEYAKNQARNIIFKVLKDNKQLTDADLAVMQNYLKNQEADVLGQTVDSKLFPRTLDEITNDPVLEDMKNQIAVTEGNQEFLSQLQQQKFLQNATLETLFMKEIAQIKNFKGTQKELSEYLTQRYPLISEFFNGRISLAKQQASDKLALLEDQISPEYASAILKREIDDALSDSLRMEKILWDEVASVSGPKMINNVIDDIVIAANSIENTIKQTDNPNVLSNTVRQVAVEEGNILEGVTSLDEILNLKTRLYDEIRAENIKKQPNTKKIDYNKQLIDQIDSSIVNNFTEAGEEVAILADAFSFSEKLKKNFYESEIGAVLGYNVDKGTFNVLPDKIFTDLVKQGQKGAAVTQTIEGAIGSQSEGIKQGLLQELASLKNPDGSISSNTLFNFKRQYEDVLAKYPELNEQLVDFESATRAVEDITGASLDEVKKNRAQLYLSPDSNDITSKEIVTKLFKETDPTKQRQNFNRMFEDVSQDPLALEGFQEEVLGYFFDNIKVKKVKAPRSGQVKYIIDTNATSKFIKDNEDILNQLYGDNGMALFKEFETQVNLVNRAIKSGGKALEDLATKSDNIITGGIGRILGAKFGAAVGAPALVTAGLGGQYSKLIFEGKKSAEIQKILKKAFLDPEFAAELAEPLVEEGLRQRQNLIDNILVDEYQIIGKSARALETGVDADIEQQLPEIEKKLQEQGVDLQSSAQIPVQIPTTAVPGSAVSSAQVVAPLPTMGAQPQQMNIARAQQAFPFDPVFAADGGSINKQGIMNTSRGRQMVV